LFHDKIALTTALITRSVQHLHGSCGSRRELCIAAGHSSDSKVWRIVMRMFFSMVGILAWVMALAVLWIFAESGGALTVIAAGVFAIVAIVALVGERVLKTLEEIRDGKVLVRQLPRPIDEPVHERALPVPRGPEATAPL
jgi:hypothetical protein